ATVLVTNTDMGTTTTLRTDTAGRYEIPLLQPGNYTVRLDATGFQQAQEDNVRVQVAQIKPLNFVMRVGQVSQSVEVNASTAALETHDSTVSTVITARAITQLPLNGRDPFALVELVPGVSTVASSNGPGNGGTTPHIAGGRNSTSEEQIDGMTNIVPENNVGNSFSAYQPVVDSVQEFSVQTSVLPAEYGRFFGGVINVVTKSGANRPYGSVFEFARNQIFDAKDYFSIGPKPGISRNQFGGTFGAPIYIPHVYNGHDRSFFFFAIEDSRENDSATETDSVPLPAFLNGDFSALAVPIYDPATATLNANGSYTRTAFTNNQIPTSRLSTVGLNALKYYPAPNAGAAGAQFNNYVTTGVSQSDYLHYDIRVDHQLRKNWHTFVRYSHLQVNGDGLNDYKNQAAQGGNPLTISVHSLSFDNVITITPKLLAEVRYGFSRLDEQSTPYGEGFNPSTLGLSGAYASTAALNAYMFPTFALSNGYSGLGITGGYGILLEAPSAHQASASLIRIAGPHSIKVGTEFRKLYLNFHQYGFPDGQFNLDQSWTQKTVADADGSGNPFASLLLGLPTSGQLTTDATSAEASDYLAFYGQDDYQVSPKLTLNVGLRWSVEIPRSERYNKLSYWTPSLPSPLQGLVAASACPACGNLQGQMVFTGTSHDPYGRHQAPIQWKDFAPRIGFAWNALPKTSIRGGFGLVYGASALQVAGSSGGSGTDGFSTSTPFSFTYNNEESIATTLDNPAPTGFNVPQGPAGGPSTFLGNGISSTFFSSYRNPYSIQTNLTVQQQLPGNTILEVGYLGNRGLFLVDGDPGVPYDQVNPSYLSLGSHLYDTVANPFYGLINTNGSPLSQPTIARNQLLRPFPQYTGVTSFRKPTADSDYRAITFKLQKNFSQGFSVLVSYTGSKTMDNAASGVTFIGQASSTYINQYNPEAEYGLSAEDQSSILVGDFLYELPFGRGKRFASHATGITNTLINGWQASGIVNYATGNPVVLGAAIDQTGLFTLGQRPLEAPGDANLAHKSLSQWFNTSLFSQPLPFQFGNAPRALPNVHNPNLTNADLSAIKNNYIGDSTRYAVQLRFEFFNAFNHPQFAAPDTGVNDASFGKITATNGNSARQIQLAAKFLF
ncbi:MAG: carboxypeptidase regulatory-like domain-containing protein, partial [Janthinobacterium lividum]